jgi:hypothetical protein
MNGWVPGGRESLGKPANFHPIRIRNKNQNLRGKFLDEGQDREGYLEKKDVESERNWVPGAHGYHPSYSGGRDQEDQGLKLSQANSFARPYLKKKSPSQKRGW